MESQCWFYCYPEKLIVDTLHLSTHDFGAYWRSLIWYYTNGPLPDDDEMIRTIMGVKPEDWCRCRGVILGTYFSQNGDGKWHNKRADVEIDRRNRVIQINCQRAANARAGKAADYVKHNVKVNANGLTAAQEVTHREEYNRVLDIIKSISSTYAGHQTWTVEDRERYKKMTSRANELRKLLGVVV